MNSKKAVIVQNNVGKFVPKNVPIFSVIIPAHNLADYIVETLESVCAQSFTDYEVIVVNDGSTDETEKKIAPFFEKIVYLKQENAGAAIARNTAIENSRGKYIAFLDGDDVWLPNYLKKQFDFIEKNGLELVYCNAKFFGEKFYQVETYMEQSPSNGIVTPENIIRAEVNFITSGTVVLREKLIENGLFDSNFIRNQDYDLWFRLVKNGLKTDYQREVLLKYRIRKGSLFRNALESVESILIAHQLFHTKYDLTESEKRALDEIDSELKQRVLIEKGKSFLVNKRFDEAKTEFKAANQIKFSPKLTIIILLLNIAPDLVRRLFGKLRPNELKLIKF